MLMGMGNFITGEQKGNKMKRTLIGILFLLIGIIPKSYGQDQAEELTKINIVRTCTYKEGTRKLDKDDCVDKNVSDIEIMRWKSNGMSLISTGGKEEDGFGKIYKVNLTKTNEQTMNKEYYVADVKTKEIAVIVYDTADRKIIISTSKKMIAFFY